MVGGIASPSVCAAVSLFFGFLFFILIREAWAWKDDWDAARKFVQSPRREKNLLITDLTSLWWGLGGFLFSLPFNYPPSAASLFFFLAGVVVYGINKRTRKKKEADALRAQFPVFLDLFSMNLKSGFSFSQAWTRASALLRRGPLKEKTDFIARENANGIILEALLERWEKESGDSAMSGVLALVRRGLKGGGRVAESLRDQASAMREAERIRFEEASQTLATRLLFPIMIFIAPAMFIAIFAPLFYFIRTRGIFF